MKLKFNMGDWNAFNPNWLWYHSPSDGRLYHFSEKGWQKFQSMREN